MRHGFSDEVKKLSKEKIVQYVQKRVPSFVRKYLIISLAALLIASPLPTEFGATLMASINISTRKFAIIAYFLHTSAIFVILLIGSTI